MRTCRLKHPRRPVDRSDHGLEIEPNNVEVPLARLGVSYLEGIDPPKTEGNAGLGLHSQRQ